MESLRIDLHVHIHCANEEEGETKDLLRAILAQGKKIMSTQDDAIAAIAKIATETTKQGTVLAAESTTLQTISDNTDALIKQGAANGFTPDLVAQLQAQADATAAISDTIQQHADFATAIASKGAANPVPVPVPAASPPVVTVS